MKEFREIIRFWEERRGQALALATLVSAQGSSYRRPGARMLIDSAGEYAGGVSAGCIEQEVIACASQVLRTGEAKLMAFDTRLRFGCHGAIEILLEPVATELMAGLRDSVIHRQNCLLKTIVHGRERGTSIAEPDDAPGAFFQVIEPALRLVVIGDGSESIALRAQAALLGWDVLQLEAAPIPADILDERTAVVLATHNYGRDCAALRDLLPAGLKYLGVVGSRRRRDDLLFDVMQSDVPLESSLFAPAGLHLGADSPEEIALSIVAEIQCVFGAGTAQQLRHRKAPIHQAQREIVTCAELPA
jgi:xanthine/CO dehydrogenase XdhC/CoxF family maturation factor